MSSERVKCIKCDRMILPVTASVNEGLCGPCVNDAPKILEKKLLAVAPHREESLNKLFSQLNNEENTFEPEMQPCDDSNYSTLSDRGLNFENSHFQTSHRCETQPSSLHPIGARIPDSLPIDIVYISPNGEGVDHNWIKQLTGGKLNFYIDAVTTAFKQYNKDWCGEDMLEEVLNDLDDGIIYPKGEKSHFEKHGYLPYFEIQEIVINRPNSTVTINGRVDCDYNLDEHGVSILIKDGKTTFGYGAEHEEEEE